MVAGAGGVLTGGARRPRCIGVIGNDCTTGRINAFLEDIANTRAAGMNAHLSKPISLDQLQAVLRQYLPPRLERRVDELADRGD